VHIIGRSNWLNRPALRHSSLWRRQSSRDTVAAGNYGHDTGRDGLQPGTWRNRRENHPFAGNAIDVGRFVKLTSEMLKSW
jgi:hypothetical protein